MKYCGKCGTQVQDETKFCPVCGIEVGAVSEAGAPTATRNDFTQKVKNIGNTADTTTEYDANDINSNKAMAILAYFGPLVLIPLLAAKDSKFARFHANQGLLLLITSILYGFAYSVLSAVILAISWRLYFIVTIIGFLSVALTALAIIGIINAAGGKAKELPLIGKFKLIK